MANSISWSVAWIRRRRDRDRQTHSGIPQPRRLLVQTRQLVRQRAVRSRATIERSEPAVSESTSHGTSDIPGACRRITGCRRRAESQCRGVDRETRTRCKFGTGATRTRLAYPDISIWMHRTPRCVRQRHAESRPAAFDQSGKVEGLEAARAHESKALARDTGRHKNCQREPRLQLARPTENLFVRSLNCHRRAQQRRNFYRVFVRTWIPQPE